MGKQLLLTSFSALKLPRQESLMISHHVTGHPALKGETEAVRA